MFDVEKAIVKWRKQMLAAGIKTPGLEELETHLREDIERQVESGRSEAEAFEAAVQKIGQAYLIQDEFKKIDGAKDTRSWMLMELVLVMATIFLPWWVGYTLHKRGSLLDLTAGQQMSGLTAVALFALLAWGGRLNYKMFPVVPSKRLRGFINILGAAPVILWWIIFMNVVTPHHDFTMGQFLVSFLWNFIAPGGALIGLLWGMETAAQKNAPTSVS